MKNNEIKIKRFIKNCMLFGIKERFFILIGIASWLLIVALIVDVTVMIIIIHNQFFI